MTNSVAILSDAVHDFGDSISIGMAWYFQKVSQKERDSKYSYGYGRYSIMGAVITAIILVVGSIFIISEAIPRLVQPEQPETSGMIPLAILGIVINGAAVLRLRKGKSLNEEVISLHLLEDVLGWIAVLIGAIVMHLYDIPILDPILSMAIAAWVLFNVYRNLKKAFSILLQGTPTNVDIPSITAAIEKLDLVKSVHDCHVWTMDGEFNILTVDVVVPSEVKIADLEAVKVEIWKVFDANNIEHATIEFDSSAPDISTGRNKNCH